MLGTRDPVQHLNVIKNCCADIVNVVFVQFEDFETEKAFNYLERYKSKRMFNDDIQGTGAVVLAG